MVVLIVVLLEVVIGVIGRFVCMYVFYGLLFLSVFLELDMIFLCSELYLYCVVEFICSFMLMLRWFWMMCDIFGKLFSWFLCWMIDVIVSICFLLFVGIFVVVSDFCVWFIICWIICGVVMFGLNLYIVGNS